MKKARSQKLKRFNKVLSVLLAAAMVAGSVPETSFAAETQAAEESSVEEVSSVEEANVQSEESSVPESASEESASVEASSEEEQQTSEESVPAEESVPEEAIPTQEESSTEENKESETAPAKTEEPVSTEVSKDNTAGEEEAEAVVQLETDETPEPAETITITMTDMKEVRYVFQQEAPEADYEFVNKVGEDGKVELKSNVPLYLLVTPKDNIKVTSLKVEQGDENEGIDISTIEGVTDPQKVFKIENLQEGNAITFEVEKTFDVNVKASTDANIESVKYYYEKGIVSVQNAKRFSPLTADTKVSAPKDEKIFFVVEPAANYDVVIKEKVGDGEATELGNLKPTEGIYTYSVEKDAELTFEAKAKDAITVELGANVTDVKYGFGSSVPAQEKDWKGTVDGKILTKDASGDLFVKITVADSYAVSEVKATAKTDKTVSKQPEPVTGNEGVYKIGSSDIANIDKITISAKKASIKAFVPDGVTVKHKIAVAETIASAADYQEITDNSISFDGTLDLELWISASSLQAADIKICDQNGKPVATTKEWEPDKTSQTKSGDSAFIATISKTTLANVTELHFTVSDENKAQAAVVTKVVYKGIDTTVSDVSSLVEIKDDKNTALNASTKADFNASFTFKVAMTDSSKTTKKIAKVVCKFGNSAESELEASTENKYTTDSVTGAVTITVYVEDITNTAKIVNDTNGAAEVTAYTTNDDETSESTDYGFNATQDIKVVTGKKFGFVFTVSDNETPIVKKVTKDENGKDTEPTTLGESDYSVKKEKGIATYTITPAEVSADTTYTITLDTANTKAKFEFKNGAPNEATNKTDVTGTKVVFEDEDITDAAVVTGDNTTGYTIGFNKDLKFKVIPVDGANMKVESVTYLATNKTEGAPASEPTPVTSEPDNNGIYTIKADVLKDLKEINFTVTLVKETAEVTVTGVDSDDIKTRKYDYTYQEVAQPGKSAIGTGADAGKVDLGSELTIYYKVNNKAEIPSISGGGAASNDISIKAVDDVLPKITKTTGETGSQKTVLLSWEADTPGTDETTENDTYKYYKVTTTIDDAKTTINFELDHKETEYYQVDITGNVKDYIKITSEYEEFSGVAGDKRQILVGKNALTFKLEPDYDDEGIELNSKFKVTAKTEVTDSESIDTVLEPTDGIYTISANLITENLSIEAITDGFHKAADIGINNKAVGSAFDTYYNEEEEGVKIEYLAAAAGTWEDLDGKTVLRGAGLVDKEFKLRFRKNQNYDVTVKAGEETLAPEQDGLFSVYTYKVTSAEKRITFVLTSEDKTPRAVVESEDFAKFSITSAVVGSKDVLASKPAEKDKKLVWVLENESDELQLGLEINKAGYIFDSVDGGTIDKSKTKATIKVKAGSSAKVAVKAAYAAVVEEPQAAAQTADGKYVVDFGAIAKISLKNGETTVNVSKVTAKAGTKALTEEQAKVNSNKAEIVFAEYAGKTITVDLYAMEEQPAAEDGTKPEPKEVKAATVVFDVSAKLTGISVSGVKKGKEVAQLVGTSKTYDVTVAPKNALANITLTVEKPEIAVANLSADKTKLTVTPKKFGSTKITLTSGTGENAVSFDFTLNAVSGVAGKAATAKIKYTTDQDYTITLGSVAKLPVLTEEGAGYAYLVETANAAEPMKYFNAENTDKDVKVKLISGTLSDAQKEGGIDYEVKVTLVQVTASFADGATAITGENAKSDKTTTLKATTKKAYYTTKLKLKKGAGTVYTGQSNVVIAAPTFDVPATYISISAEDITPSGTKIKSFSYENNQVVANVGNASLGKHTIRVTASDNTAKDDMYVASADITVTVVRGIENLELSVPSTIYKADSKKNITYTIKPVYNYGYTDKNWKPKTAKVKDWTVVNTTTGESNPYVSIKNGKLTIDKRYVLTGNDAFKVTATAADFPGNTETGIAYFTITTQKAVIADLVLIKGDNIVARDNATVEPNEIQNAYVAALRTSAPVSGTSVADYDLIGGYDLTYTSSNKNAVAVSADGRIEVKKPANNVRITVKTNDGSKLTKVIKLNVGYAQTADVGIEVYRLEGNDGYNSSVIYGTKMASADITDLSFIGSTAEKFGIRIVKRDVDENGNLLGWEALDDYTDVKAVVSGSVKKLKFSDGKTARGTYGEEQAFVLTGEKATIKLVDNKNKAIAGKTYTITNTGFVKTGKAPSVKLNAKSYMTGYHDISMTLGAVKDHSYTDEILFARVETDQTAVNAKNYNGYYYLNQRNNPNSENASMHGVLVEERINGAGSITIPFVYMYMAGSYKLKLTVGTKNEDGIFTPIAKTANVTLKVTVPKAVKVGAALTFKMSMNDPEIKLPIEFRKVLNANINGEPNEFTTYFELTEDNQGLRLKKEAYAADSKLTDNLVGYLSLSGAANDAVKVTIKLVDTPVTKYTANAVKLISGPLPTDGIKTPIYLGKALPENQVRVVKAVVDSETNKTGLSVAESPDGQLIWKGSVEKGNYTVKVWVVPSNSCYYQTLTTAEQAGINAADKGIPVNVSVKVTQAENTAKKIALGAAKCAFTVNEYSAFKGYEAGYDRLNQNYWISIPYTKNMVNAEVDTITNKADTDKVRVVKAADGSDRMDVSLSAADAAAIGFNRTVRVTAVVTYKNSGKQEEIALNFTTPVQTASDYNAAVDAVDKAKTAIEKSVVPQIDNAVLTNKDDENIELGSYHKYELDAVNEAVQNLKNALYAEIKDNSAVQIVLPEITYDATGAITKYDWVTDTTYTRPTKTNAGALNVDVRVYDMTQTKLKADGSIDDTAAVYTARTFVLNIPKLKAQAGDLSSFANRWSSLGSTGASAADITKATTSTELLNAIKADLAEYNHTGKADEQYDLSNIRLRMNAFTYDEEDNLLSGSFIVADIIGEEKTYGFNYSFSETPFDADTLKKAQDIVSGLSNSAALGANMSSAATAKAFIKAQVEAEIGSDSIKVDDKTLVKAVTTSETVEGTTTTKITGFKVTLVLKKDNKILRSTQAIELTCPNADLVTAFNAAKSELTADRIKTIATGLRPQAGTAAWYDTEALKTEIVKAANAKLSDTLKETHEFVAVTGKYTLRAPSIDAQGKALEGNGDVKLMLVAKNTPTSNALSNSDIISVEEVVLEAELDRQTIEQAKTVADLTVKALEVDNATDTAAIENAAKAVISTKYSIVWQQVAEDKVGDISAADVTENGKPNFKNDPATVKGTGTIKGVFYIRPSSATDNTEAQKVIVNLTTAKLEQSNTEVYAAVKEALAGVKPEGLTKANLKTAIEDKVDTSRYTIDDAGLTEVSASAAADGSLKGTIKIKEKGVVIRIFTNVEIATKVAPATPAPAN